ncbi:glutaredoxin [Vibrio phage 1.187.O._10N.286.49.F1]|nr:glutaredoxin [Vibrio phage 1.187.O._10N.286.49.F1]
MLKVYSAEWCSFCKKLKSFLDTNHIPYEVVDIDYDIDEALLLVEKDLKTIPQVFEGTELIGGYTETLAKFS